MIPDKGQNSGEIISLTNKARLRTLFPAQQKRKSVINYGGMGKCLSDTMGKYFMSI